MKISRLHKSSISLILAAAFLVTANIGQAQKIDARPLTHQEIHDWELPEGTNASAGLLTVGVGEPVYLEAQVDAGTNALGVVWSIETRPLAAPPSTAQLLPTPILPEMPIYSVGDREILEVAGRILFIPDVAGQYTIQAVVNVAGAPLVLNTTVTGAHYVGVGIMGGATPDYPQCALCHEDKAVTYINTGHASFFEEAIDGIKSSHYSENCIECHNLGGHAPDADNGNFASTAESLGWTFPEVLQPGNWDAMPLELKAKANIQCEHCHGAGSEHHGDITATSVSLSSGDCAQCHDEEPYHNKNRQWDISGHAVATRYPTGSERRLSCVKCHSGIGFIQEMDGIANADKSFEYEAIVCAACHDPHSNENDNHQLRSTADITLQNGHVVTKGGNGKFCINCHQSRRNSTEYVQGNVSSHYGPHYGIQGDLFNGTNAIEYDGKVIGGASAHMYALEDSCVSCHMQAVSRNDPAKNLGGEHTFKMMWDANETPDDHHDDVPMTGVCIDCHGPIADFDMPRSDYNYDGVIEGVQTEVEHLLEALALKLPPVGEPEVLRSGSYDYTDAEKKALYNYMCVEEDGSHGIHNPRYITGILKASINDLGDPLNAIFGGVNVPVGGDWYFSQWFDFYSPLSSPEWIYHFEHGYLGVKELDDKIFLYELRTQTWRYTTPEIYPIMWDTDLGAWVYYGGFHVDRRYFYNYNTGAWTDTE